MTRHRRSRRHSFSKRIFIHRRFDRGLYIARVGVCPHCRMHRFRRRRGVGWWDRLIHGGWRCEACGGLFRHPFIETQRKR